MNYIRALIDAESTKRKYKYIQIDAPNFYVSTPLDINRPELYTSHEALFLDYETTLTRNLVSPLSGQKAWYNVGAHFLWIGDRTRQPDGAHVEYMKGLENPIGIKVGPSTVPEQLVDLLNTLNPRKEIGKVTLITRFGADAVETCLPQHIRAVRDAGHIPVWVCDPMHGNTKSSGKLKTRYISDIISEVTHTFRVHRDCSSKLNGVHFEMTGECVTGNFYKYKNVLFTKKPPIF